jgi:hypothetical protein
MRRILVISLAMFALAGCNKEQATANCRLDVARKWNVEVLKSCIEPWSPFASTNAKLPNATPKCSDTDQAKNFMQLCMKTSGYTLESRCSSDRFEQFDRRCYRGSGIEQLMDEISDSDLLSDATSSPWGGYAWNKKEERLEWVNFWTSHTECVSQLQHLISDDAFNSQFYSKPIGCAYNGNSYWRVLILNALWGGKELGCIAISGEPSEAIKIGMLYGPVLGRDSPRPPSAKWHCV